MTIIYSPTAGTCMGPEWEDCIAVIDNEAPVARRDIVRLGCVIQGRASWLIKRLRTFNGEWFGEWRDGVFPIHGTASVPDATQLVMARAPWQCPKMQVAMAPGPDERKRAYYH